MTALMMRSGWLGPPIWDDALNSVAMVSAWMRVVLALWCAISVLVSSVSAVLT